MIISSHSKRLHTVGGLAESIDYISKDAGYTIDQARAETRHLAWMGMTDAERAATQQPYYQYVLGDQISTADIQNIEDREAKVAREIADEKGDAAIYYGDGDVRDVARFDKITASSRILASNGIHDDLSLAAGLFKADAMLYTKGKATAANNTPLSRHITVSFKTEEHTTESERAQMVRDLMSSVGLDNHRWVATEEFRHGGHSEIHILISNISYKTGKPNHNAGRYELLKKFETNQNLKFLKARHEAEQAGGFIREPAAFMPIRYNLRRTEFGRGEAWSNRDQIMQFRKDNPGIRWAHAHRKDREVAALLKQAFREVSKEVAADPSLKDGRGFVSLMDKFADRGLILTATWDDKKKFAGYVITQPGSKKGGQGKNWTYTVPVEFLSDDISSADITAKIGRYPSRLTVEEIKEKLIETPDRGEGGGSRPDSEIQFQDAVRAVVPNMAKSIRDASAQLESAGLTGEALRQAKWEAAHKEFAAQGLLYEEHIPEGDNASRGSRIREATLDPDEGQTVGGEAGGGRPFRLSNLEKLLGDYVPPTDAIKAQALDVAHERRRIYNVPVPSDSAPVPKAETKGQPKTAIPIQPQKSQKLKKGKGWKEYNEQKAELEGKKRGRKRVREIIPEHKPRKKAAGLTKAVAAKSPKSILETELEIARNLFSVRSSGGKITEKDARAAAKEAAQQMRQRLYEERRTWNNSWKKWYRSLPSFAAKLGLDHQKLRLEQRKAEDAAKVKAAFEQTFERLRPPVGHKMRHELKIGRRDVLEFLAMGGVKGQAKSEIRKMAEDELKSAHNTSLRNLDAEKYGFLEGNSTTRKIYLRDGQHHVPPALKMDQLIGSGKKIEIKSIQDFKRDQPRAADPLWSLVAVDQQIKAEQDAMYRRVSARLTMIMYSRVSQANETNISPPKGLEKIAIRSTITTTKPRANIQEILNAKRPINLSSAPRFSDIPVQGLPVGDVVYSSQLEESRDTLQQTLDASGRGADGGVFVIPEPGTGSGRLEEVPTMEATGASRILSAEQIDKAFADRDFKRLKGIINRYLSARNDGAGLSENEILERDTIITKSMISDSWMDDDLRTRSANLLTLLNDDKAKALAAQQQPTKDNGRDR